MWWISAENSKVTGLIVYMCIVLWVIISSALWNVTIYINVEYTSVEVSSLEHVECDECLPFFWSRKFLSATWENYNDTFAAHVVHLSVIDFIVTIRLDMWLCDMFNNLDLCIPVKYNWYWLCTLWIRYMYIFVYDRIRFIWDLRSWILWIFGFKFAFTFCDFTVRNVFIVNWKYRAQFIVYCEYVVCIVLLCIANLWLCIRCVFIMDNRTSLSPVDMELTAGVPGPPPQTPRTPGLFPRRDASTVRRNLMSAFDESDQTVQAPGVVTPEPISASTPEVVAEPAEMFNCVPIPKRKWSKFISVWIIVFFVGMCVRECALYVFSWILTVVFHERILIYRMSWILMCCAD